MNTFTKKIALCISFIALMQINMSAQNEIDALRFSETDWQGTARFMGAGKAFGAVGAEFSALNTNPASIGLYKRSDVTFTPMTISAFRNTSNYNGYGALAQEVKYNVGSAGIVLAMNGISSTLWKKFQVGYGFNRIKNYNNVLSIDGRNQGATIGSVIADVATNLGMDNWPERGPGVETWVAWESYLIDPKPGTTDAYIATLKGVDMRQRVSVTQTGGNDEMVFSFGSNYDDKLFLGATLGVPFINFSERRIYQEINDLKENAAYWEFQNLTITDRHTVRTTGINLKLGIIYQLFDFLRVGAAFHTPTYYGNVRDFFERQMLARAIDNAGSFTVGEKDGYINRFNYSLTTPLRAMGNVVFLIQQRAFISAEYEFADYGTANMYSPIYNFAGENQNVRDLYGFSHIARVGAEFSVTQIFSIRAGYNYISSPYKYEINDASRHYASAGFGFRTRFFYSDFAYAFTISKEKLWMFDPQFVNAAHNQFITHRIMLTLGARF